jgi:hypothetical protein
MHSIGDVVIIHFDHKPSVYARIESIEPDVKPKWYQVKLLFLGFPLQEMTWILKREYLEGSPFTLKDIPIRIMSLKKPGPKNLQTHRKASSEGAEVISIDKIRAKKNKKDFLNDV